MEGGWCQDEDHKKRVQEVREEFQDEGPRVVCGVWLKEKAARERRFATRGR